MKELGATSEIQPTSGRCFTVVLPVATPLRWPAGCAECGRLRPVRMSRRRVYSPLAGRPAPGIVMVPMCTRCRRQLGFWFGLLCMLCGSVFSLMNGIGKARYGVGPMLPACWSRAASLPLLLGGFCMMFRCRCALDIAGDGHVLRWSFPDLGFAKRFAAAHDARIEPPTA